MKTIDFNRIPLSRGDVMLDAGCGEGRHAISAWYELPVQTCAFDLSSRQVATTLSRLADFDGAERSSNGELLVMRASIYAIPFADNSFHCVICSEVLEHLHEYPSAIEELHRVLKPGGVLAISVPRAWPERICWWLSPEYANTEGGHVRIFSARALRREVEMRTGLHCYARHGAHALHSPYWWLRCLFWRNWKQSRLVAAWHRLLVWDLMHRPLLTRALDFLLNPVLGKSIVFYFK